MPINKWLSAALDDPNSCEDFKKDIETYFKTIETCSLIPKKDLQELEDRKFELECLEAGGVDNWSWYSESLQPYFELMDTRDE